MSEQADPAELGEAVSEFVRHGGDAPEELTAQLQRSSPSLVAVSVQRLAHLVSRRSAEFPGLWQAVTTAITGLRESAATAALVGLMLTLLPTPGAIVQARANDVEITSPDPALDDRIESLCLALLSSSEVQPSSVCGSAVCVDPFFGAPAVYTPLTLAARLRLARVFSVVFQRIADEVSATLAGQDGFQHDPCALLHRRLPGASQRGTPVPLVHALCFGGLADQLAFFLGQPSSYRPCDWAGAVLQQDVHAECLGFTPATLAATLFNVRELEMLLAQGGDAMTFDLLLLLARGGGCPLTARLEEERRRQLPRLMELCRGLQPSDAQATALAQETLLAGWPAAFRALRDAFTIDLVEPVSVGPNSGQTILITAVLTGDAQLVSEILDEVNPRFVLRREAIERGLTALRAALSFTRHIHHPRARPADEADERRRVLALLLDSGAHLPRDTMTQLFSETLTRESPAFVTDLFLERELLDLATPGPVTAVARSGNSLALRRIIEVSRAVSSSLPPESMRGAVLLATVESGSAECVAMLLAEGRELPLDWRDEAGRSPLDVAVRMGSGAIVQLLLDRGASPNRAPESGLTPLHLACQFSRPVICGRLLNAGADPFAADSRGRTPLMEAAAVNCCSCARTLIDSVVDDVVDIATIGGLRARVGGDASERLTRLLCAVDGEGSTAFQVAVRANARSVILLLIASGALAADDRRVGPEALIQAIRNGSYGVVRTLLSVGVSPNALDRDGLSPAHHAVLSDAPDAVFVALVGYGCNLNKRSMPPSRVETPLTVAAAQGNMRVIRLLLTLGASVSVPNGDGLTAPQLLSSQHREDQAQAVKAAAQ